MPSATCRRSERRGLRRSVRTELCQHEGRVAGHAGDQARAEDVGRHVDQGRDGRPRHDGKGRSTPSSGWNIVTQGLDRSSRRRSRADVDTGAHLLDARYPTEPHLFAMHNHQHRTTTTQRSGRLVDPSEEWMTRSWADKRSWTRREVVPAGAWGRRARRAPLPRAKACCVIPRRTRRPLRAAASTLAT